MVVSICGNVIEIIYNNNTDAPTITNFIKITDLRHISYVGIDIDILGITDDMFASIKYLTEKMRRIDKVIFRYNNFLCKILYWNTSKLLYVYDGDSIIQSDIMHIMCTGDNILSNIIRITLQNSSTKKLFPNTNIELVSWLLGIIMSDASIKSVSMRLYPLELIDLSYTDLFQQNKNSSAIAKIDKLSISGLYSAVTKNVVARLFTLAPNLTSLVFEGYRMYSDSKNFIEDDAIEMIIDFATLATHLRELHFCYCKLSCECVENLCSRLESCNICNFILREQFFISQCNISSIVHMIRNCKSLENIEISNIFTQDDFFDIIEALTDTNITHFTTQISTTLVNELRSMCSRVGDIFLRNYSLTYISIQMQGWNECFECFGTDSITKRNIKLLEESRFVKTKVAVPTD